uniref:T-lymphocyte surface antigen Ly-9-like n=1 Tax=Podarcis muralis TaxID=64176 RepID=UPI00109F74CA|nr:T-lymphocyte surface antigen Ly-9-like [Podarcis muralis]
MIVEVPSRRLLVILLFTPWICTSFGNLSHGMENPIYQVNGIMGESVLFPANVSQGITVEKMEWDFYPQRGGLGFWLGEFSHGKLEHPSPTDQFGQRLDMVDETTLRLKDLELDDSGIYNARICSTIQDSRRLHCVLTVPGTCKGGVHYLLERGNPPRVLVGGLDKYWLSDNGRNLRISWRKSSSDSTFTCLVSNPVDQNRASFDLLKICASGEGGQQKYWGILPLLVCAVGTSACLIMIWKKKKLGKKKDAASAMQAQEASPAPFLRGDPRKDGDDLLR